MLYFLMVAHRTACGTLSKAALKSTNNDQKERYQQKFIGGFSNFYKLPVFGREITSDWLCPVFQILLQIVISASAIELPPAWTSFLFSVLSSLLPHLLEQLHGPLWLLKVAPVVPSGLYSAYGCTGQNNVPSICLKSLSFLKIIHWKIRNTKISIFFESSVWHSRKCCGFLGAPIWYFLFFNIMTNFGKCAGPITTTFLTFIILRCWELQVYTLSIVVGCIHKHRSGYINWKVRNCFKEIMLGQSCRRRVLFNDFLTFNKCVLRIWSES